MIRKFHFLTTFGLAAVGLSVASGPVLSASTIKATSCFIRTHDYVNAFHDGFVTPLNAKKTGLTLKYLGGVEVIPRQKQAGALKRGLVDMIYCPGAYYGGQPAPTIDRSRRLGRTAALT